MFGRKNKRAAAPKGRGAAAAKQMGLFLDLNPDKMMAMDQDVDDLALEAEFAAIIGKKPSVAPREKKPAKAPLPMEDIAKMAEACMKDSDDEDDDDGTLEDDEYLLAELQEVIEQEETEDSGAASPTSPISASSSSSEAVRQGTLVLSVPGSVQHTLEERLDMYKIAVSNAKAAGESSKARRYERGLKTLQTMLVSVRKGGKIDEAEIPPPVVCGASSSAASPNEHRESDSAVEVSPGSVNGSPVVTDTEANGYRAELWNVTNSASVLSAEEQQAGSGAESLIVGQPTRDVLLERQRGYRTAALKAKQAGDVEQAKRYLKASKEIDTAIESLDKDQPADPSSILPSPSQVTSVNQNVPQATQQVSSSAAKGQGCDSTQAQPSTPLEALEQRLTKYKEAFSQAKASEDERKARMYDRIAKQYQSAIRAEKAGHTVNYDELPAPPGFPPIPGQKVSSGEQGLAAVLEAANKLASIDAEVDADDDEEGEGKSAKMDGPRKPTLAVQPIVQDPTTAPSSSSGRSSKRGSVADTAKQQLEFLEGRKKQYLKAAVQAKQKKDLEQAKAFLRSAKALDPMIEAVCSGKKVDISKVPSPPGDEDEDFILVHHSDVQASEKDEKVYTQLKKLLEEQYKKCQTCCKQFTHLGNMAETTKFENMAEESKKSLEILALAQTRGLPPPKHHFEERKYRTVRIFPELSSTDMVVVIVRGMNLPAPHGVATNDLDTYVKFDFPYPSTDHPQKHKTSVAKNTNNPEYNQNFNLNINRSHRGFRRVIQSKGLKLEVLHKGGFLRSDKPLGTAQIKLDKLEAESEVREIVEVMDGRKATGGRLEVRVRLREPLSGQDLQIVTERWLVLEEPQVLL